MIGLFDTVGDGWGQSQEIGVERLSLGLERTIPEQGVIDRAAIKFHRGGFLDYAKIVFFVQPDEALPDNGCMDSQEALWR